MSLFSAIGIGATVLNTVSGLISSSENAGISAEQAARERERTRLELQRHRRDVRRVRGEQQVQFVMAGVRGDAGSALDIIADSAAEAALDEKLIEVGGAARASFAESRARQFRRQGAGVFTEGLLSGVSILAGIE